MVKDGHQDHRLVKVGPLKAEVAHQADQTDGHQDHRMEKDDLREARVAHQVNRADR